MVIVRKAIAIKTAAKIVNCKHQMSKYFNRLILGGGMRVRAGGHVGIVSESLSLLQIDAYEQKTYSRYSSS